MTFQEKTSGLNNIEVGCVIQVRNSEIEANDYSFGNKSPVTGRYVRTCQTTMTGKISETDMAVNEGQTLELSDVGPTRKSTTCNTMRRATLPSSLDVCPTFPPLQEEEELNFSWKQSSVLYGMFLYSAVSVGLSETIFQLILNDGYKICKKSPCSDAPDLHRTKSLWNRIMEVDSLNQAYVIVLVLNIFLWVTLILRIKNQRKIQ